MSCSWQTHGIWFSLNSRLEAFEPRMEADIYYLVTAFAHTVVHRLDFAATNNFITDLVWLLELRMAGKSSSGFNKARWAITGLMMMRRVSVFLLGFIWRAMQSFMCPLKSLMCLSLPRLPWLAIRQCEPRGINSTLLRSGLKCDHNNHNVTRGVNNDWLIIAHAQLQWEGWKTGSTSLWMVNGSQQYYTLFLIARLPASYLLLLHCHKVCTQRQAGVNFIQHFWGCGHNLRKRL